MLLEVSMDEKSVSRKHLSSFERYQVAEQKVWQGSGWWNKAEGRVIATFSTSKWNIAFGEKMDTTGNGIRDTKENKLTILVRDSEHTGMFLDREWKRKVCHIVICVYYSYLKLRYMTWTSFFL